MKKLTTYVQESVFNQSDDLSNPHSVIWKLLAKNLFGSEKRFEQCTGITVDDAIKTGSLRYIDRVGKLELDPPIHRTQTIRADFKIKQFLPPKTGWCQFMYEYGDIATDDGQVLTGFNKDNFGQEVRCRSFNIAAKRIEGVDIYADMLKYHSSINDCEFIKNFGTILYKSGHYLDISSNTIPVLSKFKNWGDWRSVVNIYVKYDAATTNQRFNKLFKFKNYKLLSEFLSECNSYNSHKYQINNIKQYSIDSSISMKDLGLDTYRVGIIQLLLRTIENSVFGYTISFVHEKLVPSDGDLAILNLAHEYHPDKIKTKDGFYVYVTSNM